MFGWLKSLVGRESPPLLRLEGYRLPKGIKLSHPIITPGGGRVTLVSFCVNVDYSMDDEGSPTIHRVELWQPDDTSDFHGSCNIFATRRGEAWHARFVRPESLLVHAVNTELASENSDLRRIIVNRWHVENRRKAIKAISEGLNEKMGPEELANRLETFGAGRHMSFRYTKPDGSSRIRQVSVWKVTGNILKAKDLEDGQIKSFQLDNISDAQAIEYGR
jgi:hypothetical protein